MTWFKVDDGFWGHPKQTALPPGPVALWVRAGSWSSSQLTDGFVPVHMIAMLGGKKRDAEQLVTAGLWEAVGGGYRFHDWTKWQPTRGDVEKKRAEDAERKAEWRRKKAEQKAARDAEETGVSQRDTPRDTQCDTSRTDAVTPRGVRSSRPDPTRPDPDSPTESPPSKTLGGGVTEVDAREAEPPPPLEDLDEPPRCRRHTGMHPADVPPCRICGDLRVEWETARDAALKPPPKPQWCGECDQATRLAETGDGMARCLRCHPLSLVRAS